MNTIILNERPKPLVSESDINRTNFQTKLNPEVKVNETEEDEIYFKREIEEFYTPFKPISSNCFKPLKNKSLLSCYKVQTDANYSFKDYRDCYCTYIPSPFLTHCWQGPPFKDIKDTGLDTLINEDTGILE